MSAVAPVTRYCTFGPDHEKQHDLEPGTVYKITAVDPRAVMFKLFGPAWCTDYTIEAARSWRTPLEALPVIELVWDE